MEFKDMNMFNLFKHYAMCKCVRTLHDTLLTCIIAMFYVSIQNRLKNKIKDLWSTFYAPNTVLNILYTFI
jgi:hypothetical protein